MTCGLAGAAGRRAGCRVRRAAAARGLDEAVTWSFIPEAQATVFGGGAWTVANPISEELKVMRPSLLPGLLSAAAVEAAGRSLPAGAPRPTAAQLRDRWRTQDDYVEDLLAYAKKTRAARVEG